MTRFSIIIPCRHEEENVELIASNILRECSEYDYEIIFIDDFSQDTTLDKLKNICSNLMVNMLQ